MVCRWKLFQNKKTDNYTHLRKYENKLGFLYSLGRESFIWCGPKLNATQHWMVVQITLLWYLTFNHRNKWLNLGLSRIQLINDRNPVVAVEIWHHFYELMAVIDTSTTCSFDGLVPVHSIDCCLWFIRT